MELTELAREIGFEEACILSVETLRLLPEVREMCASGRCLLYGKRWSCPPACGSLEACDRRIKTYQRGVLVQTVGVLEDVFDVDGISRTEKTHKHRFEVLVRQARRVLPDCLPLTAGGCTRCAMCTYPKKPCRFPRKMMSSMEAYGLLVSDVCEKNGIPYYHGEGTIAFTSCILTEKRKGENYDSERNLP
ncbi:MAG: DUF2284 domain-containing protein [Oscillospiraceae bacterium]|nr:DUF2284 domain-containing protein [Oscillospiraceae bacterium]